jgi:hypothetical protein
LPLIWFLAGVLSTLAVLIVILPWLRTIPHLSPLPALPWQAGIAALLVLAAVFGLYRWLGHPELASPAPAAAETPAAPLASPSDPGMSSKAGSMSSAIAALEARLAKGGGSPGDWELLAKSFEFLGRSEDAARARNHQLPPVPDDAPAGPALAAAGRAISGEVTLAAPLRAKVPAGATLFIVAKSLDAPGAPVAVFRGSVGAWPLKFTLDDSQSMMPGRNLSNAGRVTIEARVSLSGQAMPSAGDLQGTTAVIDPSDSRPLKILIDHVIS